MYKRNSSGLEDSEDDNLDEHFTRKRSKLEQTVKDDYDDDSHDDDNDDDDENDEDDDDDEDEEDAGGDEDGDDGDDDDDDENDDNDDDEEENNKNIREQMNKRKNFTNFKCKDESDIKEKKASVKKNTSGGFAYRYMKSFGFEDGKGLGKFEHGITEPIETSKQKGTLGFGFQRSGIIPKYDPNEPDEIFDEEIDWLINKHFKTLNTECLKSWVKYGPPKTTLTDESPFCDQRIVKDIIDSKNILNVFSDKEKKQGRRRANPFEAIQNAIFLNRAAMKMANMDAILNWMFTEPRTKTGEKVVGPNELLYFADVCAGPGGFSEYVLYRKGWRAKGFGFTLRSENDFKLDQFIAGPSETFEPHYGKLEDGDVFVPENIISFRDHVMKYTKKLGVHFMMADGGIHIDENLCEQEIICKKLYLCQCIVALFIVRPGGHFVVKLFDLFTEFSVGLVYLMYRSFEEILLIKPKTSRPANSERYLVCKWKRDDCQFIAEHLFEINKKIPKFGENQKQDVLELVPTYVLEEDEEFMNYIRSSNTKLGERQKKSLLKMAAFSDKTELIDTRQQKLRKECLEKWNIPDKARAEPEKFEPRQKWMDLIEDSSLYKSNFCTKENKITSLKFFEDSIERSKYSWYGIVLSEEESNSTCGFYLGLGKNNVHRYSGGKWVKPNCVGLCLPANTIVYGELVQEFIGSERSQRKIFAFHIIDGLYLGGENIRNQNFQKRREMCTLFAEALFKEKFPVRVKKCYFLGQFEELWNDLVLKKTKSARFPLPAILLNENSFYKAVGIMFVKDLKGPWKRYLSTTRNTFFLDNKEDQIYQENIREQDFSNYYADFEDCFSSRLIWWWEEGVVVHDDQMFRPDENKMQRKELMNLLQKYER